MLLNISLISCFNSVFSFDWISERSARAINESIRTQNDAIWIFIIALFLTNPQIAGDTNDFKMNVINTDTQRTLVL